MSITERARFVKITANGVPQYSNFVHFVYFPRERIFSKFYNIFFDLGRYSTKNSRLFNLLQNGYNSNLCRFHKFNNGFMFDIYEKKRYNNIKLNGNRGFSRAERQFLQGTEMQFAFIIKMKAGCSERSYRPYILLLLKAGRQNSLFVRIMTDRRH